MIVLGVGSNLGDRESYLRSAVEMVAKSAMTVLDVSRVYETDALLKEGSPREWNKPFLNMAISGETHLSPESLLSKIKYIENYLGRKDHGNWSPREVDIDILIYNDLLVKSDELTIPHASMCSRAFVLHPLNDIAPNWKHPIEGRTIFEMAGDLDSCQSVRLTDIKIGMHEEVA